MTMKIQGLKLFKSKCNVNELEEDLLGSCGHVRMINDPFSSLESFFYPQKSSKRISCT